MKTVMEKVDVWMVWTNSDLTEGRGYQYPLYTCTKEATAKRLAHKRGVMGSNADVHQDVAYMIDGHLYGRIRLEQPSAADKALEGAAETQRAWKMKRDMAIETARSLGLSEELISVLQGTEEV